MLEDLGVAQADLVQAGLLQNPTIAGDLVNSTKGNGLGGGLSLTQSLLSVFLIPAKRRLAKSQVAHAVVTDAGHEWVIGGELSLEIPLFDPGHADIGRRNTILPRTEAITALTLLQYNAMLLGTYQLLETRSDQTEARREFVHALHDYWVAHSELELAVGGRLPTAAAPPSDNSDNPRTTSTTP